MALPHLFFPGLYFTCFMVGFCTALPGALLIQLLHFWLLPIHSSSLLFLLLFLSSCIGSLISRGPLLLLVRAGTSCMALACTALAIARGNVVFAFFCLYGLAFGVMLTSTTRLVLAHRRKQGVREVNRLNLLWGVGAFLCPTIASAIVRASDMDTLLFAVAGVLALLVAVSFLHTEPRPTHVFEPHADRSSINLLKLPAAVGFYTFIAVGTEATFGAWSTTYAHLLGENAFQSVGTVTFFWFGLLSSRALAGSNALRELRDMTLMYASFTLASAGAVIFVSASTLTALLLGALLVGLGLGPIFPTLQGIMLPRIASNQIFVIGGVASSLVPWLTGVTSTSTGSLKTGMYVPALLILLMLPCSYLLRRNINGGRI